MSFVRGVLGRRFNPCKACSFGRLQKRDKCHFIADSLTQPLALVSPSNKSASMITWLHTKLLQFRPWDYLTRSLAVHLASLGAQRSAATATQLHETITNYRSPKSRETRAAYNLMAREPTSVLSTTLEVFSFSAFTFTSHSISKILVDPFICSFII